MNARIIRTLAVAALGGALLFPQAPAAEAATPTIKLTNSSASHTKITICKTSGRCSSGAFLGVLSPGQNSQTKYGWKVAEYKLPANFNRPGDRSCPNYSRWVKLPAGPTWTSQTVRVYRCGGTGSW